jgi:hypothetical protein
MDVSIWWVLAAFVLGGYAGAVLVGLMSMAARHEGPRFHGGTIRKSRGEVTRRRRHGAPAAAHT